MRTEATLLSSGMECGPRGCMIPYWHSLTRLSFIGCTTLAETSAPSVWLAKHHSLRIILKVVALKGTSCDVVVLKATS